MTLPDGVKQLISAEQIQTRIGELADQIAQDYHGEPVILVGILTGGFMFLADLARALWQAGMQDIKIEFIRTSSYVDEQEQSRKSPKITVDMNRNISGKHVLIVEDIADTGHTLSMVQKYLRANEPKSLKTVALLNKPSRREVEIELNYFGFEVSGWIEGYGLDGIRACPAVTVRD